MNDSRVEISAGSTAFVGRDAVTLFQAISLKAGIRLYAKTGMRPNRAWTPTAMLATAGSITGKRYKRGQFAEAEADLEQWIAAMKAAMPVEVRE